MTNRESHPMAKIKKHHVIDYDTFLRRLVKGLRKAWTHVRAKRKKETFYMYGIGTDSDVVVMSPFCGTEEQYAKEGNPDFPLDKWYAMNSLYGAGSKYTDDLQDEVNRYVFEDHTDEPDSVFEKRRQRLLKIFEQALVQLDEEAFFGKGKKRHQVMLMIDRGDCSEEEEAYVLKVIKRINPPQSTARYFALVKEARKSEAATDRVAEQIAAIATKFLKKQKRKFDTCWGASRIANEAVIPYKLKLLGETETPSDLWDVVYGVAGEPETQSHAEGVLVVVVNPATGNCAIEP